MKRSFAFALMVFLFCVPAFAGGPKTQFKVKARSASRSLGVATGNSLELTLNPDSITAVVKSCTQALKTGSSGQLECPGDEDFAAAQFPPSAIAEVVSGQDARFVSIIWILNGKKVMLIFEPSQNDLPLIIGTLEKLTGKKSVSVDAQDDNPPRVLLHSQSYGNQTAALRDQSMEMAMDFSDVCPTVQVTINDQRADFTVMLNHIEVGLVGRDNQVQVYNKDGDLISGKEGGSIMDGVKGACALIATLWADHPK